MTTLSSSLVLSLSSSLSLSLSASTHQSNHPSTHQSNHPSLLTSNATATPRQGLTAYNHNLDTSPEYYEKVTTTRKYEDRLNTIESVRQAGISVCAGGIIGLGEGHMDRYD